MKIKKGLLKKILTVVCNVFLCVCVLFTVYIMVSSMNGRVADIFGKSILRVVSGSMEPSIYEGDYILVEKIPCEQLKKGDIITFYSENKSIYGMPNTHRIIDINDDGSFVTKGDANINADEEVVTQDKIIGKYSGKLRFLRWLNSFTSLKKLVILGVIILVLIMSVYELKTIIKVGKISDDEKKKIYDQKREKLIREAIEKEKQRLYDEHYNEQDKGGKKD
ncbi:MAG: signal peptidase I [Acutalibacteraceae bacterium]